MNEPLTAEHVAAILLEVRDKLTTHYRQLAEDLESEGRLSSPVTQRGIGADDYYNRAVAAVREAAR